MVKLALLFGPAEYFALMVLALTTVTAVLGDSLTRGLASLFIGLALGLVGIDLQTGQARFTLGIPEMLDGIDTVVVAVGLFAIGETLYVAVALQVRDRGDLRPEGLDLDEPGGLAALLEALAARHAPGLPDRRPARRRHRDPDLPVLPDREAPCQEPGGVRQGRDRGGGRARGREQRRRGRRRWRRSCRWACRPRPRPRSCWPRSSNTACSPARCCSTATPSWSGA